MSLDDSFITERGETPPVPPAGSSSPPPTDYSLSPTRTNKTNNTTRSRRTNRPTTLEDVISGKCRKVTSPRSLRAMRAAGYDEKDLMPKVLREMLPESRFDSYVAEKRLKHAEAKRQAAIAEITEALSLLSDEESNLRPSDVLTLTQGSKTNSFSDSLGDKVSARVAKLRHKQHKALALGKQKQTQVAAFEAQCQKALRQAQIKFDEETAKDAERAAAVQEQSRRRDAELANEARARDEARLARIKLLEEQKDRVLAAQAEAEARQNEIEHRRQVERDVRNAEKRQTLAQKRSAITHMGEEVLRRRIEDSESRHERTQVQLQLHAEQLLEKSKQRAKVAEEAAAEATMRRQKALSLEREKVMSTLEKFDQVAVVQEKMKEEAEAARKVAADLEKERDKEREKVRLRVEEERAARSADLEKRIEHHEALLSVQKQDRRKMQREIKITQDLKLGDKLSNVQRTKKLHDFALIGAKEKLEAKLQRVLAMKAQEERLSLQRQGFRRQLDAMKNSRVAASPGPGEYLGCSLPGVLARRAPSHRIAGALPCLADEMAMFSPGPAGYTPKIAAVLPRKPAYRLPTREGDIVHQAKRLQIHKEGGGGFLSLHANDGMIAVPISAEAVRPSSVPSEVSSQDFDEQRRSRTSMSVLPVHRASPTPSPRQDGVRSPNSGSDVYNDDFSDEFPGDP